MALVVVSPGVPLDLPVVKQMYRMQIPVWGEIELAYVYGQGDVLAITGTNGKTTTTALTEPRLRWKIRQPPVSLTIHTVQNDDGSAPS